MRRLLAIIMAGIMLLSLCACGGNPEKYDEYKKNCQSAPQCFGDILHAAHRYAGKIHFYESFFHAAFTAAISLNDGRFIYKTL